MTLLEQLEHAREEAERAADAAHVKVMANLDDIQAAWDWRHAAGVARGLHEAIILSIRYGGQP